MQFKVVEAAIEFLKVWVTEQRVENMFDYFMNGSADITEEEIKKELEDAIENLHIRDLYLSTTTPGPTAALMDEEFEENVYKMVIEELRRKVKERYNSEMNDTLDKLD